MKKALITVLSVAMLISLVFGQASFAATKNDILTEARKSPIFHHIEGNIVKLMEQVSVSADQGDQIVAVIKSVNAVVTKDKGPTFYGSNGVARYTDAEKDAVLEGIGQICDILNIEMSYESVTEGTGSDAAAHKGDMKVVFYDKDGNILVTYDGDLIKDTSSAVDEASPVNYTLIVISGVLLAVAAVAYVYGKKRILSK